MSQILTNKVSAADDQSIRSRDRQSEIIGGDNISNQPRSPMSAVGVGHKNSTAEIKRVQRHRKFQKDSTIYGIPVKNNNNFDVS